MVMNEPKTINDESSDRGPSNAKPRDGPATVFEADPMVADIFTCRDGEYFGLVLVANWPVSPLADMDGPYQKFLEAIKSCFRKEDGLPSKTNPASLPAVYTYPTIYLHVTLATLVHPTKVAGSDDLSSEGLQQDKKKEALELVRSASKLPGWPKEPLRLVVDSAQIGKRAGILLWKDLSGGVAAIRNCLREVSMETDDSNAQRTIVPKIPGIIHSTFLRFSEVPQTPGEDVQEAFRSKGLATPSIEFFCNSGGGCDDSDDTTTGTTNKTPLLLRADTVRLVSESTPYMHLLNDDEHVPWTSELTK